jgi:hypothetical protein
MFVFEIFLNVPTSSLTFNNLAGKWTAAKFRNTEFAVLTGVEVARSDSELPMIKHMSMNHMFKDDLIHWVL